MITSIYMNATCKIMSAIEEAPEVTVSTMISIFQYILNQNLKKQEDPKDTGRIFLFPWNQSFR